MAVKRNGLGRGLDALFNNSVVSIDPEEQVNLEGEDQEKTDKKIDTNEVIYIGVNEIKPNGEQPRKNFPQEKIDELADSIRIHGVIQPIIVCRCENGYEIIAGERRWRAARSAELTSIPCIIRQLNEQERMMLAIIENMQREDLNPIEEAIAFSDLIDKYALTQDQISKSVGRSRPYITNAIRLLKLPSEIQEMVIQGKLSNGHARALVTVEDDAIKMKLAKLAVEQGLSVREIEKAISEIKENKKINRIKKQKSPEIKIIESELKEILGTKVNIHHGVKKGKIEIQYYSKEELDRLIELIMTTRSSSI